MTPANTRPPRPTTQPHKWCSFCREWKSAALCADGICARCFSLRMLKGAA